MKTLLLTTLLMMWDCCAQEAPAAAPPLPPLPVPEFPSLPSKGSLVTESKSLQFRISGEDPKVRGTLSFMAEDTKSEFLKLTEEKDEWKIPVLIYLHGKQGDPIPKRTLAFDLQYGEDGFKLLIHVHLAHGIEAERFHSAVLTALVYERS